MVPVPGASEQALRHSPTRDAAALPAPMRRSSTASPPLIYRRPPPTASEPSEDGTEFGSAQEEGEPEANMDYLSSFTNEENKDFVAWWTELEEDQRHEVLEAHLDPEEEIWIRGPRACFTVDEIMALELGANEVIDDVFLYEVLAILPDSVDLTKEDLKKYAEQVTIAKEKECNQWMDLNAFRWVLSIEASRCHGQTLQYFWVLKKKPLNQQELEDERKKGSNLTWKVKARLAIRGDQDKDKLQKETESPTADKVAQRIVWHTAAHRREPAESWVISSAFLRGEPFEDSESKPKRRLFMVPPPEIATPGKLMELLMAVCGLVDAPLRFSKRLRTMTTPAAEVRDFARAGPPHQVLP